MIFRILSKDLKRRKTMNIILLLFVLIASLFTGSGVSNMLSVAGGLDHFYEIAGAGDMIMIFSGSSAESDTKKLVNKCDAVKSAGVEKVYLYSNCVENNGVELKSSSPAFISINDTAEKIFNENNEMITSVDEGHIYLNKSFMDINDIKTGDTITIKIDKRETDLIVDGPMKDAVFGNANMIGNSRFILSQRDFDEIISNPVFNSGNYDGYFVYVATDDLQAVRDFARDLDSYAQALDIATLKIIYIMDLLASIIMLIISIALIIVSFVILRFSVNFTLDEEFREIGVLKAIGLPTYEIRYLHTIKYMGIAAIGSVIGSFFSIPVGKVLLSSSAASMVLESTAGVLPNIAGGLFIAIVITAYAWHCTGKIKKFTPLDAIRYSQGGERFSGNKGIRIPNSKIKTALYMSLNDILSSPKRYISILITFCLCTLIILILDNVATTLKSDTLMDAMMIDGDMVCELYPEDMEDMRRYDVSNLCQRFEDKLNTDGIPCDVYTEDMLMLNYEINGVEDNYLTTTGYNVPENTQKFTEGREPADPSEIAIGTTLASKNDLTIGDTLKVDYGHGMKEVTVTGIYQSFNNMGESTRLCQDPPFRGGDRYPMVGYYIIGYRDNPNKATAAARCKYLEDNYNFKSVQTAASFVSVNMGVAEPIDAIKLLLLGISLIVVLLISILMERTFISGETNQIALLKAIGFKPGDVVTWQVLRFSLVAIIAVLLAGALSVPLTGTLMNPVFSMTGISQVDYTYNILNITAVFPGIIIAMTVISVFITSLYTNKIKSSDMANLE